MKIEKSQIISYRLCSHHIDKLYPADNIVAAAGACGLQNSPPGAWETALFNRLEGCSMQMLHKALHEQKKLLQAWSYRGAPVVFPTDQSDAFLSALIPQQGEPWIYTQGIALALDFMGMQFDDFLILVKEAALYLDNHTIQSKEALDKTLAEIVCEHLPEEKQKLWRAPSMYGNPKKHIVGEAVVSFLLRPCSFESLVVFGERQGISPTFTSYKNWIGQANIPMPEAEKKIARKFLHCYGPATADHFMVWLGCSKQQAHRIWNTIADEIEPVQVEGKTRYMLSADIESLLAADNHEPRLLLLGAHDPYLDQRDRTVILENKSMHKTVWKTVANPGAVLKAGRVIGIWKTKTLKDKLDISMSLWEAIEPQEKQYLKSLAEKLAVFRSLHMKNCTIETD